ncbi:MAG: HEPN domain-containing protein [Ruminococcus flavefaciens]|nr:HEPN domain-containing protein [Ruminococcus flavefaciens]
MLPAYDTFKDEIVQIENYMRSILYYNQVMMLDVSRSRASYKDKIIDLQRANSNFNKKKYDYSLVIVSLYGCFEQFIEAYIKDYLLIVAEDCCEYSKLPQVIIDNHINLSVSLIGKIEQTKYVDFITKEQIIRNLNDCIQHNKCNINYEAFCQHTANFRVQTLGDVLRNVGLSDVINMIKRNEELRDMYILQNGECDYNHLKEDNS